MASTYAGFEPKAKAATAARPVNELLNKSGRLLSAQNCAVAAALRGRSDPIDLRVREPIEARFGHDFSRVRIYTGADAEIAAREVGALAFTFGRHVIFGPGRYEPASRRGHALLRHELGHVSQGDDHGSDGPHQLDEGPRDRVEIDASRRAVGDHQFQLQDGPALEGGIRGRPGTIYRQTVEGDEEDSWWDWFKTKRPLGRGGDFGGGGASGDVGEPHPPERCPGHGCHDYLDPRPPKPPPWFSPRPAAPAPAPGVFRPQPPAPAAVSKLQFFHGTRWSVARQIPGNVKPLGGGDFAAGFYTHFDQDPPKARARALKWGRMLARKKPPERYAGVVRFSVPEPEYRDLFKGDKGTKFDLTRGDQADYADRQKEWLDFVTSKGRKSEPRHRVRKGRGEWVHDRRDEQPDAGKNVIVGPFYQPIPGKKDAKPARSEFKPYAEGLALPQQVLWAHAGIALLNSAKTATELSKYDRDTGQPVDAKVDDTETAEAPSAGALRDAAEDAQFSMDE